MLPWQQSLAGEEPGNEAKARLYLFDDFTNDFRVRSPAIQGFHILFIGLVNIKQCILVKHIS